MGNTGEEPCVVIDPRREPASDPRRGVGGGLGVCGLLATGTCTHCIAGDDVAGCAGLPSIMARS